MQEQSADEYNKGHQEAPVDQADKRKGRENGGEDGLQQLNEENKEEQDNAYDKVQMHNGTGK